jgi:hypothetical protein
MSEEIIKPEEMGNANAIEDKNSAEVTFGDKSYKIHRLKAGSFYQALKVYMDIIKDIAPSSPSQGSGEATTVDFDKLIVSMFQTWPEKMVNFVSVCCLPADPTLTEDKIKEESYPEQISSAFGICLKLNRVAENLKNFIAPMGEMGAEVQAK